MIFAEKAPSKILVRVLNTFVKEAFKFSLHFKDCSITIKENYQILNSFQQNARLFIENVRKPLVFWCLFNHYHDLWS